MGAHHSEPTGAYEMYVPNPPKPVRNRPFILEALFIILVFAAGFATHLLWFTPTNQTPYSTPDTTGVTLRPTASGSVIEATKTWSDKGPDGKTAVLGVDMAPGTWRANAGANCIWQVYGANNTFIDGNAGGGKQEVIFGPTATVFESQNCGTWTKD